VDSSANLPVGQAASAQLDDQQVTLERCLVGLIPIRHLTSIFCGLMLDGSSMLQRSSMLNTALPQRVSVLYRGARGVVGMCVMPEYITIAECAENLSMRPRTIERMIAAGSMTGFVDWDEVERKLIPTRPRRT
jgi:hypothetical protein